ncbi:MAG: 2-hydroxyglutaryl-CoA dehydratase [Myxococcota bacterium]|nr:2-hydroxyglutaryl-CoA dehydratase [Myxococcota bacterium]
MERIYLGLDVGSVSTDVVAIDSSYRIIAADYRYTAGAPIAATATALSSVLRPLGAEVAGVGVTGSGRNLIGSVVGADERREGMVADFAMNSICAAGTGAFLDSQARRLGLEVDAIGPLALSARRAAPISGRCTVFAESDMIHRQQQGFSQGEILAGLCRSLVKNYLSSCAKGKPIEEDILFCGGVSSNPGIVRAFEEELGRKVIVPEHNTVMGALGMALYAASTQEPTRFKGLQAILDATYETRTFGCEACDSRCEIVEVRENGRPIAYWGGACDRWNASAAQFALLKDEKALLGVDGQT